MWWIIGISAVLLLLAGVAVAVYWVVNMLRQSEETEAT